MPRGSLSRNVHIPWVTISFGSINLAWRQDYTGSRPDYFTSLTHKRFKEVANQMTLNITYCPHYGEDPNLIEREIVKSRGECLVQYGDYARNVSRLYRAMITNYTVDFDNGVLLYTFTMTSYAVSFNTTPYEPKSDKFSKAQGHDINTIIDVMKDAAKMMESHYIFEDPSDVLSTAELPNEIVYPKNTPPIRFLQLLVKNFKCTEEGKFFSVEVDDAYPRGTKCHVRIVKIDSTKPLISSEFDWGTRNGTVLDWKPGFDGAQAVTASRKELIQGEGDNKKAVVSQVNVDTGEIVTASIQNVENYKFESASDTLFVNNLIETTEDFLSRAEYAYTATLTVLGEGSPVQLGSTVVQVTPLIMGKPHHSEGLYIVEGVTDNVSSAGFTTTFELQRRMKDSKVGLYTIDTSQNKLYVNGTLIDYSEYDPYGQH